MEMIYVYAPTNFFREVAVEMAKVSDEELSIPTRVAALANIANKQRGPGSRFIPRVCHYCNDELLAPVPKELHEAVTHAINSSSLQEISLLSQKLLGNKEPVTVKPPRNIDVEIFKNTILRLYDEVASGGSYPIYQAPLYTVANVTEDPREKDAEMIKIANQFIEELNVRSTRSTRSSIESIPLVWSSEDGELFSSKESFYASIDQDELLPPGTPETFSHVVDLTPRSIEVEYDSEAKELFRKLYADSDSSSE